LADFILNLNFRQYNFGQMLFRRIRAFEQRRRRAIFVEPNPNQIKVFADGHRCERPPAERHLSLKIAQPFMAGFTVWNRRKSRQGRKVLRTDTTLSAVPAGLNYFGILAQP
jgi:hypothetical protein